VGFLRKQKQLEMLDFSFYFVYLADDKNGKQIILDFLNLKYNLSHVLISIHNDNKYKYIMSHVPSDSSDRNLTTRTNRRAINI
jgi:hypothetical protein